MTRYYYLLALLLVSPPAHAGESFSFTVAGHRIHIEAPRHCNSASCVSVSIPGIYQSHRTPDRDDDVAAVPAPTTAPAVAAVPKPPAPAAVAPVVAAPPPAPVKPMACPLEAAAPRPQAAAPPIAPAVAAPVAPPAAAAIVPPASPPVAPPPVVTRPAPQGTPKIIKVEDEQPATTPLGDWQTEGKKGSVRIEPCGRALCGYAINPRSDTSGESVLINMKPNNDSEWSGNIYSRDSKNTYYAEIAMQGPNSLRVEACAFGRFFCTGNVWTRISPPQRLITSRQIVNEPRT
jgi:Uncharacterized protein conserved in bacteria (DUF2147)